MGTQHPGDLRMQEGPLSSNDLKTGSISQKFSLSQAGDRPLSTSSSIESVWTGDSLDTEASGAHLHEDVISLPSVKSAQDDSREPRHESTWGTVLFHRLEQPQSPSRGWEELIPSLAEELLMRLKPSAPQGLPGGSLECICAQRGTRTAGR